MTTKSIFSKRLRNSNSLRFGNSVFSIEFEQNTSFPVFGCRYKFFLEDAIYSLPEYLVHFPTFVRYALPLCTLPLPFSIALSLPLPKPLFLSITYLEFRLAEEYGLELILKERFHDFYLRSIHHFILSCSFCFLFFFFSFFLFFYFSIFLFFYFSIFLFFLFSILLLSSFLFLLPMTIQIYQIARECKFIPPDAMCE